MNPKQILIQSISKNFLNLLNEELSHIPSIRYNYYKANGIYTISIKCANYYQRFSDITSESFYGSYIYLYTNLSLLLSALILSYYERNLIRRAIRLNYFYFENKEQEQIKNIASSILDPDFPIDINKNLYMYRKETILNALLKNFRKCNHINVEAFVNFSLTPYLLEIENTVDKSVELYLSDMSYMELIRLILNGWLP